MDTQKIEFTHDFVDGLGWQNTTLVQEDFSDLADVTHLGELDGIPSEAFFIGFTKEGAKHSLKGFYKQVNNEQK